MSEKCEHELNITEEAWMSESTALVTAKCNKCSSEFRGLITKI
jgi:hypothetical protein